MQWQSMCGAAPPRLAHRVGESSGASESSSAAIEVAVDAPLKRETPDLEPPVTPPVVQFAGHRRITMALEVARTENGRNSWFSSCRDICSS